MSDLIRTQIYQCLMMVCSGMATMLVKEIYDNLQMTLKLKGWQVIVFQLTFYILAAYLFSRFLYACAMGEFKINCIACFALGLWLWKKFFYDIINPGENYGQEEKR